MESLMKQSTKWSTPLGKIAFLAFCSLAVNALAYPPAAPVVLGLAGNFTALAKTGISTTGVTVITGDIGLSPAFATGFTGFGQTMDISGQWSTSPLLSGKLYAADYAPPTPADMGTAVLNMEAAYTDAAGRAADVTELLGGNLTGLSLVPGVYSWSGNVTIPTDLTLVGSATDVWIFQIAGTLDLSSATKVVLSGGALASNIFWQVAGNTSLGTNSIFNGTILDMTLIALNTGATLNGRALAQSAVTLDGNAMDPNGLVGASSGSATPSPSPSSTPSATRTSTASATVSATPSASASSTRTSTPSPTPNGTFTSSPTPGTPTPVVSGGGDSYIYPSPARGDTAAINYFMKEAGSAEIKIHNQTGRLVDTIREDKSAGWVSSKVSVGKFAPGTYYYLIYAKYDSGSTETQGPRKFVVTR
jgi:hypothetical protein